MFTGLTEAFAALLAAPAQGKPAAFMSKSGLAPRWPADARLEVPGFSARVMARARSRFSKMLQGDALRLLAIDLALGAAVMCFAYFLRFGYGLTGRLVDLMFMNALVYVLLCWPMLTVSGLYEMDWRYPSVYDLFRIPRALVAVFAAHLFIMHQFSAFAGSSRLALVSAIIVHASVLLGVRLVFRLEEVVAARTVAGRSPDRLPVLLIGGGVGADQFVRALQRDRRARFSPVGILSHSGASEARVGARVRGVPVLGSVSDIERVAAELGRNGLAPRRFVFTDALSALTESEAAMVIDLADRLSVKVGRMPRLEDLRHPAATPFDEIRPIEVTDLLERPQVTLDRAAARTVVAGKRVLVTGAGGSIGKELASQLATLSPAALVLVDNCEFNLFTVERLISAVHRDVPCFAAICDVRDRSSVRAVFRRFRPDLVFHAAALKHVPLVELNPIEGILTNAIGSRNVADAADAFGASAFVQVSTDKAVNTTNVMGATKRIGELYCQALDIDSERRIGGGPRFMTVRFGNVLGTSGSLIPLFQDQLARGGPLTVTDPEMRRFFMSIGEAVSLILQSSCFAFRKGVGQGRIFVLEMGEPMRILDIARRMIVLAGLTPDRDVKIEIVGRRPGEKLFEELFDDSETLANLGIPGVTCAVPAALPLEFMAEALDRLEAAALRRDARAAFSILCELLPGYRPSDEAKAAAFPLGSAPAVTAAGPVERAEA